MSRERAHRRAERERLLAAATAAREAEAARQARSDSRRQRLTGWLPRPAARSAGSGGVLAARQRQQTGLVVAFVITANVLTWLGTTDWPPRVLVLLLSVLLTPIALSILSRK